jgi:hypothetical protein
MPVFETYYFVLVLTNKYYFLNSKIIERNINFSRLKYYDLVICIY